MNTAVSNLTTITNTVTPILKKYGVLRAGIFGSYARGDAGPESDVDILVTLGDKKFSLWDLVEFRDALSEELNKSVDLVADTAISPYFKEYIYQDLQTIYERK